MRMFGFHDEAVALAFGVEEVQAGDNDGAGGGGGGGSRRRAAVAMNGSGSGDYHHHQQQQQHQQPPPQQQQYQKEQQQQGAAAPRPSVAGGGGSGKHDSSMVTTGAASSVPYYSGGCFDYALPRPPTLGEEQRREWTEHKSGASSVISDPLSRGGPFCYDFEDDNGLLSSCAPSKAAPSMEVELGEKAAPPACYTWAQSLNNLLQDPDGVKLFLRYLEWEGPQHAETLHFLFACEGLKNHNQPEKIHRLVKLIYRTYFMKSALPISEDLRRRITRNMKSSPQSLEPPVTLFDEAQSQVERLITTTTYPNFLESDMYLQHLQSAQGHGGHHHHGNNNNSGSNSDSESSASSSTTGSINSAPNTSSGLMDNLASGFGPLPTLHEDVEFTMMDEALQQQQPLSLVTPGSHTPTTATPRLTKDMLWKSQKQRAMEVRPKSEEYAGLHVYRGHAGYSSYNPVSRQDSERQSLSSQSDARSDSISLASSTERKSCSHPHKQSFEERFARMNAAQNRQADMNEAVIPRTHRQDVVKNIRPMDVELFADILRQKLENLQKEQERDKQLNRKLSETGGSTSSLEEQRNQQSKQSSLEAAVREKLHFQDQDNDQDILDQHVSRVFSDDSQSASPRPPMSPRGASPQPWGGVRKWRRDRDGYSNFSGDSGNFSDKNVKAPRSMPSRKSLAELTDSGVSVVSDTTSSTRPTRVMKWLMETSRERRSPVGGYVQSEMAVGRKYRDNSLERNSVAGGVASFGSASSACDESSVQLQELRRQLMENDAKIRSKQKSVTAAASGQSTLRKSQRGPRPLLAGGNDFNDKTIVVFSFCDEIVPYRTKILGQQVTLRQFKEVLPKKGNYRYFFKTICEDLSNQVTQEEVVDDGEVLPLWEGKIMAQVKPID